MKNEFRDAAECLLARYRNDSWFFRAVAAEGAAELHVREGCPFVKHRPVNGVPVKVVLKRPPKKKQARPTPSRNVVRLPPPPPNLTVDVAGVVKRIKRDRQIVKWATEFREGVLGDFPARGACYMVAAPMATYLKLAKKIECELVELEFGFVNHYVIQMKDDGKILDPTADQFNEYKKVNLPPVYFGEMPGEYSRWMEEAKRKKFSANPLDVGEEYDWSIEP